MLQSVLDLLSGLLGWGWGLIILVTSFCWDFLYQLHVEAPRLEGLLVGIALAWLMLRRDKHPLLRVASAPLKLVVDILDLAWDQVVEVAKDLWGTARNWVMSGYSWCRGRVVWAYERVMSGLSGLRNRLSRKGGE
jgi:hypothetical protein|tara:strand:+ start:1892 stop:2296 length:405 start_codon:yes stop_codon:yes gene_type:complete